MRVIRPWIPLLLALFSCSGLSSQQIISTPQRDANSLAVLNTTVSALGGTANLSQTNGIVALGNLVASPGGVSGPVKWENMGSEFRYERPGPNGPIVFVSGHGDPAILDGGAIRQGIVHQAMVVFPWYLPGIVLSSQANNPNVSVQGKQSVTVNGVAAIKISTVDQTDDLSAVICKQDWYLDATTLLPFRVDYLDPDRDNALNTVQMTTLLSDYRQVSGVLIPFHITTFFQSQQIWDVTLTSVQLGQPIPSSDFDVPVAAGGEQ
jgi:hypothetical protein